MNPSPQDHPTPPGSWQPPALEEMQQMLPQYLFERLLGCGGMGAVYKAVQVSLDRAVAIKVLPSSLLDDEDVQFGERFKNEARTMARMNHPNIVNVYDFGETRSGLLYFVMEFVDGTDVAQMIISQGRLPESYALSITAHVCDALAYAHGHKVVHRDIKPANILINMQGQIKVADFGLAKQGDAGNTTGLTKTNVAMGTPDFVAPEALTPGVVVDGRADLYAVGVMLYQMLTGDIPRGLFLMPSAKTGGILDPRFDAIIAKAMQTDRESRYPSATDLRRDLDAIISTPRLKPGQQPAAAPAAPAASPAPKANSPAPAPAPKSQSGLILSLTAVAAVLAIGAFFLLGGKDQSPAELDTTKTTAPAPAAPKPAPSLATAPTPPKATSQAPKPAPPSAPPSSSPAPAISTAAPAFISASPATLYTNSLGIKFVPLPGTSVHIAIHETRRQDYAAFDREVPGVDATWKSARVFGKTLPKEDSHPVCLVSWQDAQDFCKWLSQKEGHLYRLPTEREWNLAVAWNVSNPATISDSELAQQIGSQSPWGKLQMEEGANLNGSKDGFDSTAPVMSFPPNSLGIYDLGGNVWEWCDSSDTPADTKVLRGCGFMNFGSFTKSGQRQSVSTTFRQPPDNDTNRRIPGFRLILDSAAPKIVALAPGPSSLASAPQPGSSAPAPVPQPAQPTDPVSLKLASLEKTFLDAYEKQVGAAHKAAVSDLNTKYLAALDRSITTASKDGKLEEALTLRNEKTLIQTNGLLPEADDEDAPAALKSLRKTWREQMAVLITKRNQAATPLNAAYDRALSAYQDELTKAQKLDEASRIKAVRNYVTSQQSSTAVTPPAGSPAATSAATNNTGRAAPLLTAPAAPPLPASRILPPPEPASQEEIRKLCEWVLQKDGTIRLRQDGRDVAYTKSTPLPRGRLTVVYVNVYSLSFEAADNERSWFTLIGRVPDIEALYFNKNPGQVPLEDLRGLTKLKTLHLTPTTVDDAAFAYLSGLKNLESLSIGYQIREFTGTGLAYINENLLELSSNSPTLSAAGLAYLPRFKKLKRLLLRGDSLGGRTGTLNDSMLAGLAALTELEELDFAERALDGSFLAYLPNNSKLKRLFLEGLRSFKPENIKYLSKLRSLDFLSLPNVDIGTAGLSNVSSIPVLRELVLAEVPNFTGEVFKGIKGFRNLQSLFIRGNALSDSGLDAIAAAIPGLTFLELTNAANFKIRVTPEGFSRFLNRLRSIRKLNFHGELTTDAWIPAIAQLKDLDYLMLTGARVSDQGLKPLMKLPLTYLRLDGTPVTDAVIPILKSCPTLVNVPVGSTQMTPEGKVELEKILRSR